MFKISVLIPTYNGANYIKSQLELFLRECNNLRFNNFIEITISDNFSTDSTEDVVNYYKNKIKNKFISINYFKKKKNVGYYLNFLNVINVARGEYVLLLCDHDIPERGFYKELKEKLTFKNFNSLVFLPIKNVQTYKPKIFELNKLGYVCERGSKMSGVMLKKDNITFKYLEKSLYVQNIIYINYYLTFGLKEIRLKHKIIERGDQQSVYEKFNDRIKRKNDFAVNDKLRSIEIFYLNKKINYLQYIIGVFKIYTWSLEIKWELRLEKKFDLESIFINKITQNNRKIIIIILFIIFIRNLFNRRRYFFFKTLISVIFS